MGRRQLRPAGRTDRQQAAAAHSPAVAIDVLSGQLVFVSGQIARSPDGEIVGAGDVRAQTRYCFERVAAVLESAGGALHDVARLVYYLVDLDRDLSVVCQVRDGYDWPVPPASTVIQVSRLAHPALRIEIEATAIVPRPPPPHRRARSRCA